MRFVLLCTCVAVAVAAPIDQWDAFLLTYSKLYDDGEMQLRLMKSTKGYWGQVETAHRGNTNDQTPVKVDGHLPSNIDWRTRGAVTPVKNQGQCGSCWAFGATGSMEGVCFLKRKYLYTLSEQQLVDCSRGYGNFGCSGGWHQNAYKYVIDAGGSVREDCYRYEARDAYCRFEQARHCIACVLTGYRSCGNEAGLASALNTAGPVGVAIDSSRSGFRYYRSGIYDDYYCNRVRADHVVLVVGYDNYSWIVKNSWGTHWGNGGYILMRKGYNICGIANDAHYPTM